MALITIEMGGNSPVRVLKHLDPSQRTE